MVLLSQGLTVVYEAIWRASAVTLRQRVMRRGHHFTLLGSDGEQNLGQTPPLELTEYLAGGVSTFREQRGPKRDDRAHREGRCLGSFKMEM